MSFYKILEEIDGVTRFQLIQKSLQKLELRLVANEKENAFMKAQQDLQVFLAEKGIQNVTIVLSNALPQANKISGKFNHICKDLEI